MTDELMPCITLDFLKYADEMAHFDWRSLQQMLLLKTEEMT